MMRAYAVYYDEFTGNKVNAAGYAFSNLKRNQRRSEIIRFVWAGDGVTATECAKRAKCNRQTAQDYLRDLEAMEFITHYTVPYCNDYFYCCKFGKTP